MKVSEIIARLNGVSTPIGGVSWTPAQSDVEVARRVLVYLEDRRVLYVPYEAELPGQCIASALDIRRFLTEQLTAGRIADDLTADLRSMRAACRKFVTVVDVERATAERPQNMLFGVEAWGFNQALGEMRGVFGVHIAQVAVRYGIDVPEPLEAILPAADANG